MSTPLFKTTIEIWTTYDPAESEIVDLAAEATDGDAVCTRQDTVAVDPDDLDDHDGGDAVLCFFDLDEDDLDAEPVGPPIMTVDLLGATETFGGLA